MARAKSPRRAGEEFKGLVGGEGKVPNEGRRRIWVAVLCRHFEVMACGCGGEPNRQGSGDAKEAFVVVVCAFAWSICGAWRHRAHSER